MAISSSHRPAGVRLPSFFCSEDLLGREELFTVLVAAGHGKEEVVHLVPIRRLLRIVVERKSRSVRPSGQVEDSGLGSQDNSCQEMETQETEDTDILSPDL